MCWAESEERLQVCAFTRTFGVWPFTLPALHNRKTIAFALWVFAPPYPLSRARFSSSSRQNLGRFFSLASPRAHAAYRARPPWTLPIVCRWFGFVCVFWKTTKKESTLWLLRCKVESDGRARIRPNCEVQKNFSKLTRRFAEIEYPIHNRILSTCQFNGFWSWRSC